MNKTVVEISEGHEVWCYGSIEEDSNFNCVFQNPCYDGIVADIDTSVYDTWEKIVKRVREAVSLGLEEISSC